MILIAFRHSDKRLFARLVTLLRGGDSAHVESAIPDPDGRLSLCISSSWLDGGVRGKVIDITDPHKWRVYAWEGEHVDLMDWLRKNMHRKYDKRGLLGILNPRIGQDPDKMFCSEAVAQHLGFEYPHTYDLVALEDALRNVGAPAVAYSGVRWRHADGRDLEIAA